MNNARERGRNDRRDGKTIDQCPYEDARDRDSWKDGWAVQNSKMSNDKSTNRKG